jgi:hypothetical protein
MEWDEDAYLARRAAAEQRIRAAEQHADDREDEPDPRPYPNEDAYLEHLEDVEARDFYMEDLDAD